MGATMTAGLHLGGRLYHRANLSDGRPGVRVELLVDDGDLGLRLATVYGVAVGSRAVDVVEDLGDGRHREVELKRLVDREALETITKFAMGGA